MIANQDVINRVLGQGEHIKIFRTKFLFILLICLFFTILFFGTYFKVYYFDMQSTIFI